MKAFQTFFWMILLAPALAFADAPKAGLDAEGEKRWDDAIHIYRDYLKTNDTDYKVWLRIADIEATRGNVAPATDAVGHALKLVPETEKLALHDRHAQLATWQGEYKLAEADYEILHAAHPDNDDYLLRLARVEAWQGMLDDAAEHFKDYLSRHASDHEAIMSYAYVESWRGDFAHGLELLDQYETQKGDPVLLAQARTRFYAGAGYTNRAVAMTDAKLATNPDDFQALYSKTIAYKEGHQLGNAIDSLAPLNACCAEQKDVKEMNRFVKAPARHAVELGTTFDSDSDDVSGNLTTLQGQYRLNPDSFLIAGTSTGHITASQGSTLEAVDGDSRINDHSAWLGLRHAVKSNLWVEGAAGVHDAEKAGKIPLLSIKSEYRARDNLAVFVEANHDYHRVSPRAVSLDITRTEGQVRTVWQPDMRWTVESYAGFAGFSDDNTRTLLGVAPRRAVYRTENFNVDLGVSGRWLSFSDEPGNGYYSPASYRQYLVTAYTYYKLSDDSGISLILAPGIHKDESLDGYKFSGNLAAEGVFGLYDDWMLRVRAGLISNIGVNDSTYRRAETGVYLTRRF